LLDFVRQRTPERAAVPVRLTFIEVMPLTGVGKIFKPTLRMDAAQRMVSDLLSDLVHDGCSFDVNVGAHEVHGQLITVTIQGVSGLQKEAIQTQIHSRLSPLVMKHQMVWQAAH
jgi:fatty-acyl-CoA synthase